jgi:hypothetical protein
MIEIKTYIMKKMRSRDKEKYPFITPNTLKEYPLDFFIPVDNEREILEHFRNMGTIKTKFLNSVMVIKVNEHKIMDFDQYSLDVWFDYFLGVKQLVENGESTFRYGIDPVNEMQFFPYEKELFFRIEKKEYILPKREFLLTLMKEIQSVIIKLRSYYIYHEHSKIYSIPHLDRDMKEIKKKIEVMEY